MHTIGIERREEHGSVSPTARLSRGRDTAPQAPQTGLCLNTPGRPPCCPEKKLHACCKDTADRAGLYSRTEGVSSGRVRRVVREPGVN